MFKAKKPIPGLMSKSSNGGGVLGNGGGVLGNAGGSGKSCSLSESLLFFALTFSENLREIYHSCLIQVSRL